MFVKNETTKKIFSFNVNLIQSRRYFSAKYSYSNSIRNQQQGFASINSIIWEMEKNKIKYYGGKA